VITPIVIKQANYAATGSGTILGAAHFTPLFFFYGFLINYN
jgi:hypothetical protein